MSGPGKSKTDIEIKAFILFLYRYYIRLKWVIEKIRYRHQEFDPYDDETIKPLYKKFLEDRRRE
jgi:hypothetical protein